MMARLRRWRPAGGVSGLVVAGLVAAYVGFGMAVEKSWLKNHPAAKIVCVSAVDILDLRRDGWGIIGRGTTTQHDTGLMLARVGVPGVQFVVVDSGGWACPISMSEWTFQAWTPLPEIPNMPELPE